MFDWTHSMMISIVIGFFTVVLGVSLIINTQTTTTNNNLEDAVRTAFYNSRDNSARTHRGLFIENKKQFVSELSQTKIKDANNQLPNVQMGEIKNPKANDVSVQFLHDDQAPIATDSQADTEAVRAVVVRLYVKNGNKLETISTNQVVQTYGKTSDRDAENDVTR